MPRPLQLTPGDTRGAPSPAGAGGPGANAGHVVLIGVTAVAALLAAVGAGLRVRTGRPPVDAASAVRWTLTAGLLWGTWRGRRASRWLLAVCFGIAAAACVGPAVRGDVTTASIAAALGGQAVAVLSPPVASLTRRDGR